MISGAAASPLDPPILAPVQKRNNFITAFKTRQGTLVQVHVVLQGKQPHPFSMLFIFIEKSYFPQKRQRQHDFSLCCYHLHAPFLKSHTHPESVTSVTTGVQ